MKHYLVMPLVAMALSGAITVNGDNPNDGIFGPFNNGYTTTCKHSDGNLLRMVRVQYLDAESHVPCEVRYAKPTEQPNAGYQVLWHAHHTEGYCERKAKLLVSRLKGWGWQCGEPVWSDHDTAGDAEHEHDRTADASAEETEANSNTAGDAEHEHDRTADASAEETEANSNPTPTRSDCARYGGFYCD